MLKCKTKTITLANNSSQKKRCRPKEARKSGLINSQQTTLELFLPLEGTEIRKDTNMLPSEAHDLVMPDIFIRPGRPVPSQVFCTFWWFAYERQNIFYNKIRNPTEVHWTTDSTLRQHKFTNAYRASDRASQFLICNVQKSHLQESFDIEDIYFRTLIFKFFNKIETWELLENRVGEISWRNYNFQHYDDILSQAYQTGQKIYSAAYIMPAPPFGHKRKHSNHLKLLETMMKRNTPRLLHQKQEDLSNAFGVIRSFPGIGDFLAYQYVIDLNYGRVLNGSENTFVKAGPGALDGIRKCFTELGDYSPEDVIRYVCDQQELAFERLGLHFLDLWGRPLKLIDCQNLFCEVDKYARKHHPEVKGVSDRTRIKQIYRPKTRPITFRYPYQWKLNQLIETDPGYIHDASSV